VTPPPPPPGASISGTVYNDVNGNGLRDNGEPAAAGQQVYLDIPGIGHFVNGDPATTTDGNGAYSFTGIPAANYLVRLTVPNSNTQTQPGAIYAYQYYIQLGAGATITGKDFGLAAVAANTGGISGTVFYDTNGNGVRDTGDAGIAGRQLYLDLQGLGHFVAGDPIATTDALGTYHFTALAPHNYIVRLMLPTGATQTLPTPIYGGFYWVPLFGAQNINGKDFGIQGTLTTLATFNNANGSVPYAGLYADAAGNLFGTTIGGGDLTLNQGHGYGTVFQIAAATHALTTVANFNGANGSGPYDSVIADAAGNLYGTTIRGGPSDVGTVFEIAAGTHAITTIATFNNANGTHPYYGSLLADAAGNLYGTTREGGASANTDGTVFEIAAGTHTITTLVSFNGTNGAFPEGTLIADAAGNLYGTTDVGGANGRGTVFEVAAGTHALTTLVTFDGSNGSYPETGLIADAAGNLYGTTYGPYGSVYEVAAGTHAVTTLVTFDQTNGTTPNGRLIADAAGNLYGTTTGGGPGGRGTVFQIAAGTHAYTVLAAFDDTNGNGPFAGVVADAAGNLYGTTAFGGANGIGTVFELSGAGFVVS
jgi:uncharacterized repeat protein (TIGR03803 family)